MSGFNANHLLYRVIKAPAEHLMLSGNEKTVLVNFLDAMNPAENGTLAWCGAETIARRWGWNERTARRAIQRLCELDLLKLQYTKGRVPVYAVNTGLIHRLLVTGQPVREAVPDRTQSPATPDTESGLTGLSVPCDRTQSPAKNQRKATEPPIENSLPVGFSPNVEIVAPDPRQRRLALHQVISGAAERMRSPCQEKPTGERREDLEPEQRRTLPAGARQARERPG